MTAEAVELSLLDLWETLTETERVEFLAGLSEADLDELERMLAAEWDYRSDPCGWVNDVLGEFLWSKQRDIMEAVRDHRRVVVRSGHGVGKSRVASRIVVWWGSTHPPAQTRIVTTATTFAQVRNVLWQEIASAARTGKVPGRVLQTEWHILDLDQADDDTQDLVKAINTEAGRDVIVGVGRKPADHDQAAFQGTHARYVLVVIDEADGVPAELFTQALAIATGPDCRIVAIGNPVDPTSHMATICAPGSGWHQMWISVLHLPTITQAVIDASDFANTIRGLYAKQNLEPSTEQIPDELRYVLSGVDFIEDMLRDFGPDAPSFTSRVLGSYPDDSTDGVVPRWAIERVREPRPLTDLDVEPVELGVDVGAGRDRTVIRLRRGVRLMPRRWTTNSRVPEDVVSLVMEAVEQTNPTAVKIDALGWGWGVVGHVRERCTARAMRGHPPVNVVDVWVSEASGDPRRFVNQRAEIWWMAREMCQAGVWDLSLLDKNDPVLAELVAPRYTHLGDRVRVEPKEDTKKRLKRSPDDADAANLSFFTPPPSRQAPAIRTVSRWSAIPDRR